VRNYVAFFLSLALFIPWAASAGSPANEYGLRLELSSDGHGNTVYRTRTMCDFEDIPVANYLFVNQKTGEQRWLFPKPQHCIWRVFYFTDRPQVAPVKPSEARAVVYDVTPSGDLDTWGEGKTHGFRICMGTNPCLPLRRIFVSRGDGRSLTPLTPTFQILDPDLGPPNITQRQDGLIVLSFRDDPHGAAAEFSVDAFKVLRTWAPPHW
jgi:hypothetical protein